MSRATQIADRKRIEAFFREMLRADRGITAGTADTLSQRIARRIKRVVVWDDEQPLEPSDAAVAVDVAVPTQALASPPPAATPPPSGAPSAEPASRAPATHAQVVQAPVAPETATASAVFDPYAFSAVVVLTKAGKDGLMKRLAAIEHPEHLRKLADAQHLAVDATLTSTAELRAAIVKAAESRIANRRAAAS